MAIDLQGLGKAGKLGEFHAAAAGFPHRDAFRRDVERLGYIRLQKAQFLTPAAQQDVEWWFSDSNSWILVHKFLVCVNETGIITEKSRSNTALSRSGISLPVKFFGGPVNASVRYRCPSGRCTF